MANKKNIASFKLSDGSLARISWNGVTDRPNSFLTDQDRLDMNAIITREVGEAVEDSIDLDVQSESDGSNTILFTKNGEVTKIPVPKISAINNLESTSETDALSANMGKELYSYIQELQNAAFPLSISNAKGGNTVEIGQTITSPYMEFYITRKGSIVTSGITATVSINSETAISATVADSGKISYTGSDLTSDTTYSFSAKVGGLTKSQSFNYYFRDYRYYGEISSKPTTDDERKTTIFGLSNKNFSTETNLGSVKLSAGKYYMFAVLGSHTFTCHYGDATVDIEQGTIELPQFNNRSSSTKSYTYVIVPASSSAWTFTLN